MKYCLCCVVCVSLASMCWHVPSGVFPSTCCWKRHKKRFDRVGRDQLRWCHCVRHLLCQHFQMRRRDWLWRNISEQYMYIQCGYLLFPHFLDLKNFFYKILNLSRQVRSPHFQNLFDLRFEPQNSKLLKN